MKANIKQKIVNLLKIVNLMSKTHVDVNISINKYKLQNSITNSTLIIIN